MSRRRGPRARLGPQAGNEALAAGTPFQGMLKTSAIQMHPLLMLVFKIKINAKTMIKQYITILKYRLLLFALISHHRGSSPSAVLSLGGCHPATCAGAPLVVTGQATPDFIGSHVCLSVCFGL